MANDIKLNAIIDKLARYGMPVRFLHYVDKNIVVERGKKGQNEVSGFFSNLTLKLSPKTLNTLTGNIAPKSGFDSSAILTFYHEATHAYLHIFKNKPEIRALVDKIPKNYQKQTGERVFGYEYEWRGCTSQQVETIKKMPSRLKDYCDKIILEGKIPDTFIKNTYLYADYKKLLKEAVPLRLSPQPVRGGGRIPASLKLGCAYGSSRAGLKDGCVSGRTPGKVSSHYK